MKDNSGSGKGKNNLHDPTLRNFDEGRGTPQDKPRRKREGPDASGADNASALGGHVTTRSHTQPTPEDERSR
jgi:hypothetical protein